MRSASGRPDALRLIHVGVHNSANRNAGDTLLFPVVRRAFDAVIGPFDWQLRQAWDLHTRETTARINARAHGLVLGGGGLLLRDQDGSDTRHSGWQWNSTVDAIHALEIPMAIFAIGYNRFRGQEDFEPVFRDHIAAVASRAAFIGLRNSGSIRALKRYLPTDLTAGLRRQFCPTTVLWQLYPEFRMQAQEHDSEGRQILAFNAAFDRAGHRFGPRAGKVLFGVALALRKAQARGWTIVVTAHKTMDRDIEPYLDAAGVTYDTVDLTDAGPEEIMGFYAGIDVAVGMRGHAQMIPFGLRRPIVSLISHDKMRFFLEDIGRPDWGIEIDAPELETHLLCLLERIETDRAAVHAELARMQATVWQETCENLRIIGRRFVTSKRSPLQPCRT